MLVLTRKLNESLIINGNIRVTVVHTDGGKVRPGHTAAHGHRHIYREEVYGRIQTPRIMNQA